MPKFSPKQVEEINTIIASIAKAIKPKLEIGACDKALLTSLLSANNITKSPTFFKCKREYSTAIVSHFVKEKGLPRSRFDRNAQTSVFLL